MNAPTPRDQSDQHPDRITGYNGGIGMSPFSAGSIHA
jgi:hypothetical protein